MIYQNKNILQQAILWDDNNIENVLSAIEEDSKKQLIFQGPPGTGKTWVAKHFAEYLCEDKEDITLVQFHPSYGYEEFIQGLRPEGSDDGFDFSVRDGVVLQIHRKAMKNPEKNYVLIIDEMNRGNLPKIFGELMYSLEYRADRKDSFNDMSLQYSNEKISLAPNIYFFGTMNTADRSIRSIDIALRRRFVFIDCMPDGDLLKRFYQSGNSQNEYGENLFSRFNDLNERLVGDLDEHHQIGHSFFMHKKLTKDILSKTWRRQLKPLLDEYFFDRPETRKNYVNPFN